MADPGKGADVGGGEQQQGSTATNANDGSARSGSSSTSWLMLGQIKMMSLLGQVTDPARLPGFGALAASFDKFNLWGIVSFPTVCTNLDEDGRESVNKFLGNFTMVFGLLLVLILVHLLWISHREAAIFAVERTKQMTKNEEQLMRTRAIHDKLGVRRTSMDEEDGFDAQAVARADSKANVVTTAHVLQLMRRDPHYLIYIPHIEILWLLFCFEGAVEAQSEAIVLGGSCPKISAMALVSFLCFPVLLLYSIYNVIHRMVVAESAPLVYRNYEEYQRQVRLNMPLRTRAWRGLKRAWKEGTSIFTWAARGEWHTKANETSRINLRRMRIGYEPLFSEYTRQGSKHLLVILAKGLVLGVVAGAVGETKATSFIFLVCGLGELVALAVVGPFNNLLANVVEGFYVLCNCMTLGLLVASQFDDSLSAEVDALMISMSMLTLTITVMLLYLDMGFTTGRQAFWSLMVFIRCAPTYKIEQAKQDQQKAELKRKHKRADRARYAPTRKLMRALWYRTFIVNLRLSVNLMSTRVDKRRADLAKEKKLAEGEADKISKRRVDTTASKASVGLKSSLPMSSSSRVVPTAGGDEANSRSKRASLAKGADKSRKGGASPTGGRGQRASKYVDVEGGAAVNRKNDTTEKKRRSSRRRVSSPSPKAQGRGSDEREASFSEAADDVESLFKATVLQHKSPANSTTDKAEPGPLEKRKREARRRSASRRARHSLEGISMHGL